MKITFLTEENKWKRRGMLKPLLLGLMCLALSFSITACGAPNPGQNSAANGAETTSASAFAAQANDFSTQTAGVLEEETESSEQEAQRPGEQESVVYLTSDISASGLVRLYDKLGWEPEGKTAVKLSTGEPPESNYLRPELIGELVKKVQGTIVECNTAYGGSRASSAMHRQVAEDHGFTAIADFDLLDEEGKFRAV